MEQLENLVHDLEYDARDTIQHENLRYDERELRDTLNVLSGLDKKEKSRKDQVYRKRAGRQVKKKAGSESPFFDDE